MVNKLTAMEIVLKIVLFCILLVAAIFILCLVASLFFKDKSIKVVSAPDDSIRVTYHEIEIEGCEYLVTYVAGGQCLCHKGNCKNHKS